MEPENCQSNHEQILSELAKINTRMDKDMEMIKASYDDLTFRNRLWSIFKVIGFGTAATITYKLFELLTK